MAGKPPVESITRRSTSTMIPITSHRSRVHHRGVGAVMPTLGTGIGGTGVKCEDVGTEIKEGMCTL